MSTARWSLVSACFLMFLASISASGLGSAPVRQDPGDDEEAAYRQAVVHRSLEENCLFCHTEDIITGQRLTASQWKAEVDKMINWGSPLPKEAVGPLIDYLARRYSDREPTTALARSRLQDVDSYEVPKHRGGANATVGDLARGERLYAANCATCHGPTALGGDLGPSLVGKAILDHRDDYDRIANQGLRRMPGFRLTMKEKDQADVLAWLRHRSYPEPTGAGGR